MLRFKCVTLNLNSSRVVLHFSCSLSFGICTILRSSWPNQIIITGTFFAFSYVVLFVRKNFDYYFEVT